MIRSRALLCWLILLGTSALGHAAQRPRRANTVPRPDLRDAREHTILPANPDLGEPAQLKANVRIPASTITKEGSKLLRTPSGATMTISLYRYKSRKEERANRITEDQLPAGKAFPEVAIVGRWLGRGTPEDKSPTVPRDEFKFELYRPDGLFLLIYLSWPEGNRAARADAFELARYVLWTISERK